MKYLLIPALNQAAWNVQRLIGFGVWRHGLIESPTVDRSKTCTAQSCSNHKGHKAAAAPAAAVVAAALVVVAAVVSLAGLAERWK